MKTILKWDLRQRRNFIFWWTFGVFIFVFITLIFYPAIKHQAHQLDQSFQNLSQTAKQLFTDTNDIFSPVGYLSSQIFYLLLPMLLGILAITLGSSLINREEKEGTIELLLSQPLSRARLIAGKTATATAIVIVVGLLNTLATVLMCKLVGLDARSLYIFEAGCVATILAMAFGAVAFTITMLGRRARAASVAVATVVALGGYIVVSLAGTVGWLRAPAKVFPFYYYHASELLTGNYNWLNVLYFAGLLAACGFISWLAFRRRDINIG